MRRLNSIIILLSFIAVCDSFADVVSGGSLVSVPLKSDGGTQQEDNHFLRHHPFYFVYGAPLSKVQMSFKTPILREVPLYFGFTTFTFWALKEESKPFRDVTYNPELFYRWSRENWAFLNSLDFGIWGHTSNGKSGPDSRSYEQSYLRFNFDRRGPAG